MFTRQKYIWQSRFSRIKTILFGNSVTTTTTTIPRRNLSSFADTPCRRLSVVEAADWELGLWLVPANAVGFAFDANAG